MQSTGRLLSVVGGVLILGAALAHLAGLGGSSYWWKVGLVLAGLVLLGLGLAGTAARRAWLAGVWARQTLASPGECLLLGAFIGLATGFAEMIHQGIRIYGMGRVINLPLDIVWMAPVSYLVFLSLLGGAFALVARRWPALVTRPLLVAVLLTPAVWSQFLLHQALGPAAMLILSAGVGLQAGRSAVVSSGALTRLARRLLPWMIAIVVLVAVVVRGGRALEEGRALADASTPPDNAPNVLLVVLDTLRADHVGWHGYERDTTPAFDALAAEAVVFEQFISSSPWTLPAHATMFTGRYRREVSASWTSPLDATWPTLAEVMTARGWATGGFVGNIGRCSRAWGVNRGFARYEAFYLTPGIFVLSSSLGKFIANAVLGKRFAKILRNDAITVTDAFLGWHDERRTEERPWFAFLNYYDAHALYDPPPHLENRFGARHPVIGRMSSNAADFTTEEIQGIVDAYDACILSIDEQFARIVERLRETGELDNTLIIVTADHGELFGENGLMDHANSLYKPLTHLTLYLRWPELGAPRRIADYASLRDLPATVLDLAGIGGERPFPGRTLARFWDAEKRGAPGEESPLLAEVKKGIRKPEWEPISRGSFESLLVDGWLYIVCTDGAEELYDWNADPAGEHNRIADPAVAPIAARARLALSEALARIDKQ